MKNADGCCGSGGSFNLKYYEVSRKINELKLTNILATKAEYLVTGCPACIMHISDGLGQKQQSTKVLHTAQLLAKSYGKEGK